MVIYNGFLYDFIFCLISLDVLKPLGHKHILEHELEGFGIRLNKSPPNIYFKQKEKGGLALSVQCPQSELDKDIVAVS